MSEEKWHGTAPIWMRVNVIFFAWIFIFILSLIAYNDVKNKTATDLIKISGLLSIFYFGAFNLTKVFLFHKPIKNPEINETKICLKCGKNDSVFRGRFVKFFTMYKGFRFPKWNFFWHCYSCDFDEFEVIQDSNQKTIFYLTTMLYTIIIWTIFSSAITYLF